MRPKTKITLLGFLLLLPWAAFSADSPKWTLELSGGLIYPRDSQMQKYYGQMPEMGISFARRIMSVLDIGATFSYAKDVGSGYFASSGVQAGEVTLKQLPVDIFAVFRARFSENQWIVPYVGGGYTRLFYQQDIVGQQQVQGSVGGEHVRAGLQFLLDPLGQDSADVLHEEFGVINSYFFLEAKRTHLVIHSVGTSLSAWVYNAGLLLEY